MPSLCTARNWLLLSSSAASRFPLLIEYDASIWFLFQFLFITVECIIAPECPPKTYPRVEGSSNRCCKSCPPGTFLEGRCFKGNTSKCTRCPDDQFTDSYNTYVKCIGYAYFAFLTYFTLWSIRESSGPRDVTSRSPCEKWMFCVRVANHFCLWLAFLIDESHLITHRKTYTVGWVIEMTWS